MIEAIKAYTESKGFKEGIRQPRETSFKYEYQMAMIRVLVKFSYLKVAKKTFSIGPEDNRVKMKI